MKAGPLRKQPQQAALDCSEKFDRNFSLFAPPHSADWDSQVAAHVCAVKSKAATDEPNLEHSTTRTVAHRASKRYRSSIVTL